ncbi:MAG: phosphoribosylformylglycinamidine synthase subunit PurL [Planctomycetes bacterium]|nr:phosphoribosylformylglycinamidine synthase subunit PurL [Planctomycetota bacterium]
MHLVQVSAKEGFPEGAARAALSDLREAGLAGVTEVRLVQCYLLSDRLARTDAEEVAVRLLADPVTQAFHIDGEPPGVSAAAHSLLVLKRPGVMDSVALSLIDAIASSGKPAPEVRTGRRWLLFGEVCPADLLSAARRVLANETIEEILLDAPFPRSFPRPVSYRFTRVEVGLEGLDDAALLDLSRRRGLSLNLAEMRTVRDFFAAERRAPTDAELETIAQTWSEHCKHKTLTGRIRFQGESIDNLLASTIMKVTREIDRPDCLSVFKDNAGVIRFDATRAVCMKVETHNHPSAIEPYGGAGTGIGGVIRDIMGTGLGARPILNTDVFCFGPPDLPADRVPRGTLHPRRVMNGVVAGVRDYGNRMGIPTANGAIFFDERYVGNPLVFCGTVGVMPSGMVEKRARAGDLVLVAGGRTGRDGIHGVTFASVELTADSEKLDAGAVQIGNPIEEKKLLDAQLRARDLGLYTAVTDCGGGGLSSAIGEMGEELGVRIELSKVPLKYAGLSPVEIWISEAQERMVFAVPPGNADAILAVFAAEGCEAVVVGEFTGDHRLRLVYEGNPVADLPMEFLHHGLPRLEREATWSPPPRREYRRPDRPSYGIDLRRILSAWNVCSKETVIRQYDHEVQGLTAVKPLVGARHDGPGDATVITVEPGETRGLVVSNGLNPRYADLDPYAAAAASVDEAVRNSLAVGGRLTGIALLDNFSWGNCDKPDRLGAMVLACRALYDIARVYRTPFVSGKDSLNNEYQTDAGTIVIPHTLLVSSFCVIEDVRKAVTMDLKSAGNDLFVLGETLDELGGSHWLLVRGEEGGEVPMVRPETALNTFAAVEEAIAAGFVRACHDLSEGGLAVALAESSFAGGLGVEIDLGPVPRSSGLDRDEVLLFSESQSRFIVETEPRHRPAVEKLFSRTAAARIGRVTAGGRVVIHGLAGQPIIDETIEDLRDAFRAPLGA